MTQQNDPTTRVSNRASIPPSPGASKLTVLSGADAGKGVSISRNRITVGRHSTNDLVLRDSEVSGVHFEVSNYADVLRIRDVSSKNGTWFGTHRIFEAAFSVGTELRVGSTILRIEFDDKSSPVAASKSEAFGSFVGTSRAAREIFSTLERVASKDVTLYFEGESGVGKELLAKAVHAGGPRKDRPFLHFDAAIYSDDTFGRACFGVTDDDDTLGLIEQAEGGTLFVDGAESLSPAMQVTLMNLLDTRTFKRVNGTVERKANVRFIFSSRRDLRPLIEEGRYSDEFYLRIATARMAIPPLRERTEDIAILATKIVAEMGEFTLAPTTVDVLSRMPWLGNVTELRSVLQGAVAIAEQSVVLPEHLRAGVSVSPEAGAAQPLFAQAKERSIAIFERAYLSVLMRRCHGNLSLAARESGLTRHHCRDLLRKHGLYDRSWVEEPGDT